MRSPGEVLSAMVAAFNTGRVGEVGSYVDDAYVDHQGLPGEEIRGATGFARVVEVARAGYDELTVTVEDLLEDERRAAGRLRWTASRPTGETVERETLEIIHVKDGCAVEHWGGRS